MQIQIQIQDKAESTDTDTDIDTDTQLNRNYREYRYRYRTIQKVQIQIQDNTKSTFTETGQYKEYIYRKRCRNKIQRVQIQIQDNTESKVTDTDIDTRLYRHYGEYRYSYRTRVQIRIQDTCIEQFIIHSLLTETAGVRNTDETKFVILMKLNFSVEN